MSSLKKKRCGFGGCLEQVVVKNVFTYRPAPSFRGRYIKEKDIKCCKNRNISQFDQKQMNTKRVGVSLILWAENKCHSLLKMFFVLDQSLRKRLPPWRTDVDSWRPPRAGFSCSRAANRLLSTTHRSL